MIQIDMDNDEQTRFFSVSLKGHAGFAAAGSDIICSAASMLANNLALWVCDKHLKGEMEAEPYIRLDPGDILIAFNVKENALASAEAIFLFVLMGYWKLAKDYPEYVSITSFGEDDEVSS